MAQRRLVARRVTVQVARFGAHADRHPVGDGADVAQAHATCPTCPWPHGRVEGRLAFEQVLRQACDAASHHPCQDWWWVDADFADWPLGERATVAALDAWARSGRRLYVLARHFNRVQAHQPRFVTWRRTWDHLIEVRACPAVSAGDMPSGIWSPQWALSRTDPVRSVAVCGTDATLRARLRLRCDELWARAAPAWPASVLGL